MDRAMIERAALVALLRRPGVSWTETALSIQENGSATDSSTASSLVRRHSSPTPYPPPIRRLAEQLGVRHEALRNWVRQAEVDAGERTDRPTSEMTEQNRRPRREVADLRRAGCRPRRATATVQAILFLQATETNRYS